MTWKPHVTVAAVAERDGRFLLVEEIIDGRRVINQPAGHLDEGESLVQAVVRETREETAWTFEPEALVGIYRWRSPRDGETFVRVTFCGQCTGHDDRQPLDKEIVRTAWLSREALAERRARLRSPLVLRSIDDYLEGRRHPLDLLVEVAADG